jgi:tellurite resistance protein TerC
MEVNSAFWIGFIILIIVLLLLDMFAFHKKGEVVNVKKALWLSFFWISLALIFNAGFILFSAKSRPLNFLPPI